MYCKNLIGIVTTTLLSTVMVTLAVANDRTTHHLLDSSGNPILTNRPGECVQTPKVVNTPTKLFEICSDVGDKDRDGIFDDEDVCPKNTQEEIAKGIYQTGSQKGCPIDSDHDKVPNYRDDCPENTFLEISKDVNLRGCPLDTDQDTVPDYKDLCPDTPFGVAIDIENGCEIIEGSLEIVLAGDVTFAYDKAILTPQAKTTLDKLVEGIQINFLKTLEIVGHTDGVGSQKYNQNLAEERAETVASYLINQGIPPYKIQHHGEGEHNPVASNQTKVGRALNRRVEIKIARYKKNTN